MNTLVLIGNVGSMPEEKEFSGLPTKKFSIAETSRSKGEEKTTWWTVYLRDIGRQIEKGARVMVSGNLLPPSAYIDKQGNAKVNLTIWATGLQVLNRPKGMTEGTTVASARVEKDYYQDDLQF